MDQLRIEDITWRGLPAWLVSGASREAVITAWGGCLAAIRGRGDALNPLWEPSWPAPEPARMGRHLGADMVGSFLCLPRFGDPHPDEDMPAHGEAFREPWTMAGSTAGTAVFTARLPRSGLAVERRLSIDGDAVILTTRASGAAQAVEWCEHATLGGDFLEGCVCTAGADLGVTFPRHEDDQARFAGYGVTVDPAAILAVPQDADPPCGDIATLRLAEAWWRADNPRLGWRLTASWDRDAFPWLTVWTQHRSRRGAPWLGRERARGLEISTKPFPEGLPPPERAASWHGRPTTCVVPPSGMEKTIRFSWART